MITNSNFDIKAPKPTRTTDTVGPNLQYTSKEAIPANMRFEFMTTTDETGKVWRLEGGVANSNWVEYNSGGELDTDDIENKSFVPGADATDALNYLYNEVNPPVLENMTFIGLQPVVEFGHSYDNPVLMWDKSGFVTGQKVSSSDGQLNNEPVGDTESSYSTNKTFTRTTNGSIAWSVVDDHGVSTSASSLWVLASYTGKNSTGHVPTETEIEAGTKHVVDAVGNYTSNPSTTNTEYGWFAVDRNYATYTTWYIDTFNKGNIGAGEFIRYEGIVGKYKLYMYNYSSEVNVNIKLD